MTKIMKQIEEWFDAKFGDLFTNPYNLWRWEQRQELRRHKNVSKL
jgi:hypothetical protein